MEVHIEVIAGPAKGQHFTFTEPDCFLFGRAADARVSLPTDPYVSRQHFLLEISPPECKVSDLDSKNGLFVNGMRYGGRKPAAPGIVQAPHRAQSTYLKDGDEITVGQTRLKVGIRQELVCVECGAKLSAHQQEHAAWVGNTYLCDACRQKRIPPESAPVDQDDALSESSAPDEQQQPIYCSRCGRDVTEEAAAAPNHAELYVCQQCQQRDQSSPLQLMEQMLEAAAVENAPPSSPVISGYQIEKEVGRGGMGRVYKAYQIATNQPVAIKTMLPHVAMNPDNVRTFQREIAVSRQLDHPNIVKLLDYGNLQAGLYLVMEFIDGPDLYQLLKSKRQCLLLEEAVPIIFAVLNALAYAHQVTVYMEISDGEHHAYRGLVHRDLKPQNILLTQQGQQWVPKLTDFGTSKSFEAAGFTDITVPGDVLGTPLYWPREQITHYRYLNPATDVFSIAAVFYEMLTGSLIREGFKEMFSRCKKQKRAPTISDYMRVIGGNATIPIRQRNPEIPEPVAQVLDRALQEAEIPHDEHQMRQVLSSLRYPDAGAFRDALAAACQEAGVSEAAIPSDQSAADQSAAGSKKLPYRGLEDEVGSSSSFGPIVYSVMQPSSTRHVALLVLDLEQSSAYIHEMGDTHFSNLIGSIYRRIRSHYLASDLVFLKSTGDGFLAVFHSVETAFSIALTFLHTPIHPDISLRMALHWGSVKTGPDGDVLGAEVHRVFRIESAQDTDKIDATPSDDALPTAERILVTRDAMAQLSESKKIKFNFAGRFRLKGFEQSTELWLLAPDQARKK